MGTVVMVFSGEYDLASREALRVELESLISERDVIFDFSDVTYIDSTCISEFLRVHGSRHANGFNSETIVTQQRTLKKLFDVLSLQRIFRVVDSIDEVVGKNGETLAVRYAFRGGAESDSISPRSNGEVHSHRAELDGRLRSPS